MFEKLEIMRLAGGLAAHASARQSEVARNVANADTPGYRARDLPSFEEAYRQRLETPMRATRPGHLTEGEGGASWRPVDAPDAESPNGNTVSLEDQMVRAAEVRHQHDLALGVYSSTLNILRTSIGRR
jgi:flagellar basal-body rod protein FlgB